MIRKFIGEYVGFRQWQKSKSGISKMKLEAKRCSISAQVKDRQNFQPLEKTPDSVCRIRYARKSHIGIPVTLHLYPDIQLCQAEEKIGSKLVKFRPVNERTSGIRLSNDEEGRSCHFSISQRVIISLFIGCFYLTICALFASSGK